MPRRRYPYVLPLFLVSLLLIWMSLPGLRGHFFKSLKASASPESSFTVNSTGDGADSNLGDSVCNDGSGACTLRAAIQQANSLAGNDIIGFALPANSTITLNTELNSINSNLVINGPGAGSLTVQRSAAVGTPNFRIFTIDAGATVTISDLTITKGSTGASVNGGGLSNSGTLSLTHVNVTGNKTGGGAGSFGLGGHGGGIYNLGPLTISGSTISNNQTGNGGSGAPGGYGGGINNQNVLTITDSIVSGNLTGAGAMAVGRGGGIFNSGTLNMINSSVDSNQTAAGSNGAGGGIVNVNSLTLTSSSVTNNTSPTGAGIYSENGTNSLTDSVISGNQASSSGGGITSFQPLSVLRCSITNNTSRTGGGIYVTSSNTSTLINSTVSGNRSSEAGGGLRLGGSVTLTNVTITDNRSDSDDNGAETGGGIFRESGVPSLNNTLVARNFRGSSPGTTADDIAGALDPASSFNLIGTGGSGGLVNGINNNQVGVADPRLGPLANNGGPTQTHSLLVGSPAIDAGNSSLTSDQRGQPRPIDDQTVVNAAGGNASDIGAYEAHNFEVNSIADTDDGLCRALGTGNGCTLREAINAANADVGAEVITFAPALTAGGPAVISLLTGQLELQSDVSIVGPGANLLKVQRSTASGTPSFTVFWVDPARSASISGLTISNGDYSGIFNSRGSLVITGCVIDSNRQGVVNGFGGGTLVMNNSVVSNSTEIGFQNEAQVGGIVTATINNSTISGNLRGGVVNTGVFAASIATLTVNNSTISGNNLGEGSGGGITTGGVQAGHGITTINNCTISGNKALDTPGFGGGVSALSWYNGSNADVTINDSTITANYAPGTFSGTAGISVDLVDGGSATIKLHNTIVAGNTRSADNSASDIFGSMDPSSSFNLIGTGGSGGLINGVNHNQVGVANPRVGPLANNGGTTLTHALLSGSPALDAGDNAIAVNAGLITDQRGAGFARIIDGPDADTTATVDIGAFEAQVSVADIPDQTINEDGSLSLPFNVGGAASITSVTATSSNTALVPNNPANISISGSGSSRTLSINPVANDFGSSTITVTVNGSNSQTMTDTFVLTVNSVNDAPSFTKGPDQTVTENDGAQTVNNWATNMSTGPANESGQTLSFIVTNNSNPTLFAVAPAITSTGTLTYTPATGQSGTAQITIALMDNGGTANSGVDTSATQSFNINVLEGGTLAFSAATYSVAETGGAASITITRSGGSAGTATVLFTTSDGTATAADYTSISQTITFNNGDVSKTVDVPITDDLFKEADETVNLTLSNAGGSGQLGAQATAVLTILDNDPPGGYIRFSSATFQTTESSGSVNISVERVGDTTQPVAVNYATAEDVNVVPCGTVNGIASSRCDFTSALGTLRFAAGETSKSFAVLITQDSYVEGPESLTIILSSPAGGALLATPSTATLTIADDASEPSGNPIDIADAFVRQHYHDFLNREPDAAGLAFWSEQITRCQQPGATCDPEVQRVNVSAAFFLSIEFQETGYLVERTYKTAYGDADAVSALDTYPNQHPIKAPIVKFIEFLPDSQQISKDVMVGIGNWQGQLEANKVAFTQDFVTRTRFVAAFPTTLTPAEFVDKLFLNAGVTPMATERSSIIDEFGGAGTSANTTARARALRRVAENPTLNQAETNKAFVLMQYFGYLRRDPNAAPDIDHTGYDFWLHKLDQFNGNYINAEMVRAFISSIEYRQRFAP